MGKVNDKIDSLFESAKKLLGAGKDLHPNFLEPDSFCVKKEDVDLMNNYNEKEIKKAIDKLDYNDKEAVNEWIKTSNDFRKRSFDCGYNLGDTKDNVNHPSHYQSGKFEVIDIIEEFTKDYSGAEAFAMGNVIKYVLRSGKKNGIEDLKKAQWYLNYLIKDMEVKEANRILVSRPILHSEKGLNMGKNRITPLDKQAEELFNTVMNSLSDEKTADPVEGFDISDDDVNEDDDLGGDESSGTID